MTSLIHRYVLRLTADAALLLFLVFAGGAGLWVVDEYLGWNLLPDLIDKYAEVIVMLFGVMTGLCIAASVLCSIVLMAEAAAERAGIAAYRTTPRAWRTLGVGFVLGLVVLGVFYKIDLYRKGVAKEATDLAREATNREWFDRYSERLQYFRETMPRVLGWVPEGLKQQIEAGSRQTKCRA